MSPLLMVSMLDVLYNSIKKICLTELKLKRNLNLCRKRHISQIESKLVIVRIYVTVNQSQKHCMSSYSFNINARTQMN